MFVLLVPAVVRPKPAPRYIGDRKFFLDAVTIRQTVTALHVSYPGAHVLGGARNLVHPDEEDERMGDLWGNGATTVPMRRRPACWSMANTGSVCSSRIYALTLVKRKVKCVEPADLVFRTTASSLSIDGVP